MGTAFVSHPACLTHLAAPRHRHHPDRPERLNAIRDRLISEQLMDFVRDVEAPRATRGELELVHAARYVTELLSWEEENEFRQIDADTIMDGSTMEAAFRATGAVVHATDLVVGGEVSNAFCNIRPPGHHASQHTAMGFCFFNNVAVGVAHALATYDLKRIAVIDFDAHHGNGTEAIFRNESRVLTCSVYQRELYEKSLESAGGLGTANIALEPGAGSEQMRDAIRRNWDPALMEFQPEMIFVSAGFDGHIADHMSDLRWGDSDYLWLSEYIVKMADTFSKGRIVSVLEGGYELASLGRCGATHVRTLLGV